MNVLPTPHGGREVEKVLLLFIGSQILARLCAPLDARELAATRHCKKSISYLLRNVIPGLQFKHLSILFEFDDEQYYPDQYA